MRAGALAMVALLLTIAAVIAAVLFRNAWSETDSTTPTLDDEGNRSMFEDSDTGSITANMSDEDSPARGLWDPTSIYYDHSDHSSSSFDDSSITSSSSFDD